MANTLTVRALALASLLALGALDECSFAGESGGEGAATEAAVREIQRLGGKVTRDSKTGLVARVYLGDAVHLAAASYYRMEVLLTWNCRHLANPSKMGHIRAVNRELGLPTPLVTTPLNYVGGDDNDG